MSLSFKGKHVYTAYFKHILQIIFIISFIMQRYNFPANYIFELNYARYK